MRIIRCSKIYPVIHKLQTDFGWDDFGYTFGLGQSWSDLLQEPAFVCEASKAKLCFFSEFTRSKIDGKNPISRLALTSDLPRAFVYSEVPRGNSPKERLLFDLISGFGWKSGVTIPIHAYGDAIGIVTFNSRKEHVSSEVVQRTISYLTPWLFHFNAWARQLLRRHVMSQPLSKREFECMQLVSRGMTSKEISQILAVKKRTVDFHVANATKKLKTTNRIHAASVFSKMQALQI